MLFIRLYLCFACNLSFLATGRATWRNRNSIQRPAAEDGEGGCDRCRGLVRVLRVYAGEGFEVGPGEESGQSGYSGAVTRHDGYTPTFLGTGFGLGDQRLSRKPVEF